MDTVNGRLPEPLFHLRSKRLLVVAHPDDEALFAAGMLIRYPGDWTVVCCSIPYNEPIRAWNFFKACEALRARGRLLPWPEKRNAPLDNLELLNPLLDEADLVVTHGAAGEYGHPGHISVHNHIAAGWREKALFIGYRRGQKPTGLRIDLNEIEWRKKLFAIRCYSRTVTWAGKQMPAHESLLLQYHQPHGMFDLSRESYDTI